MTQVYVDLVDQVNWLRSRWRFRQLLEGLLLGGAICLAVLLVVTTMDQGARFGHVGRLIMAGIFWCAVVGCIWRLVLRPLAVRPSDDHFAALVEQQFPSLSNHFINAIQLGRGRPTRGARLIDAIIADAVTALDQIDISRAVTGSHVRRSLIAAICAGAVFGGYLATFGPAARTSLARVVLPMAQIVPFTYTHLAITPEKTIRVLEAEPLTITAKPSGVIPAEAQLHWTDWQGRRSALRMQFAKGSFTHTFASVLDDIRIYVTAGDARSTAIDVLVEPRPRIESMGVTYHYPAYAGMPDRTDQPFNGHLHGLARTRADLTLRTNKNLESLTLIPEGSLPIRLEATSDKTTWTGTIILTRTSSYRLKLMDTYGYEVFAPGMFTISLEVDALPAIRFVQPGRDVQRRPEDSIKFRIVARDDLGLANVRMFARINESKEATVIDSWPFYQGDAQRQAELTLVKAISQLGLKPMDRLEYWATVEDRNTVTGPGRGQTRRFHLLVLTAKQALVLSSRRLSDYARVVAELIRMQRRNRADTAALEAGLQLVTRQSLIRRNTMRLSDVMVKSKFAGKTIITELNGLAAGPMADVLIGLEKYRDAAKLEDRKQWSTATLAPQDNIIERLEAILMRLDRNQRVHALLRKMKKKDPAEHEQVAQAMEKLVKDLDKFLMEMKQLTEKYEKIAKRAGQDISADTPKAVTDVEHRRDRWKKWLKDTVDEIAKLPEGFVKDSHLRDDLNTIFEEVEKQPRSKTTEIATPLEEGAKGGAELKEDVEMWMPHAGDSVRWAMEDPAEGTFDVPAAELPESLQDMIGDLIEEVEDFDEQADDVTSAWGANMEVAGWDIADGPISVFSAQGKTGNQLPNSSEITGRSGGGRRGRSSGQMVGSESRALEGRPTPARVTKEPYEEGVIDAKKQLDPHGATGGGKKTGGGQRGLQGSNPPDMVKDMPRLRRKFQVLREKSQLLARQFQIAGRSSWRLGRAVRLMQTAEQDLADRHYADAARRRKAALSDLRALQSGIDEAISLSLDKARHLPPELRKEIAAGSQQPLPKGYEDIVGAYYRALSAAADERKVAEPSR